MEGADDLATEYASADLALCAFGVTAYELAAFGVPAHLSGPDARIMRASASRLRGMPAWAFRWAWRRMSSDDDIAGDRARR